MTLAENLPASVLGGSTVKSREIYLGIQCLRFVAAFMVVVFHATYYTGERLSPATPAWINGGAGVDIFFMISGFVMMITASKVERQRGKWADFMVRRLIRIVPLYWIATTVKLCTMLVAPALVLHATVDWNYVLKSYLFIPAYAGDGTIAPLLAVGWTLLFEMFFYLIMSLALLLRASLLPFCGACLLLCAVGSLLKPDGAPAYLMYLNPIVLEFFIGMIFARWAVGLPLRLGTCIGLCVGGLAIIFIVPATVFDQFSLARAIGPALLVLGVIGLEPHVSRFPPVLVFMGAASYSLYITHPLIAPLAPTLLHRAGLIWPISSVVLCIVLALPTASIVFVVVERPLGRSLAALVGRRGYDRKAPR